jgi:hypothetical protein
MKNQGFKNFTAIMIALVTISSAMVAWRAAVASTEANQADFAGLAAAINAEEASILNHITVYEHYQAFLVYTRYNELGNRLADDLNASADIDPGKLEALEQTRSDSWGIAYGLQSLFFPSRYLRPDGTYDFEREMDEEDSESERQRDVKPALHFTRADALRLKSNLLIGTLVLLGLSLWNFTCAQILERSIKYGFAIGGLLLLGASLLSAGLIELLM